MEIAFENMLDLDLKDRVAVVTGAAMGIGKAILNALDKAGCSVAAVDVEEEALKATMAELEHPENHFALIKDLERSEDCESIAKEVEKKYGRIDVLVNNAGIVYRTPVADVTMDMWKKVGDINLRSQFLLCRSAAEVMKKNNFGRIVNFSSQGHFTGGYDQSVVYSAFKGATVTMSKGLARQFAPYGITVNVVAPGPVNTRMMGTLSKERFQQFVEETVLLKRAAEPKDMAMPVLFLVSKWANYITGMTLDVNGGMFMR